MKQLDPKAVWMFFLSYSMRSFLFIFIILTAFAELILTGGGGVIFAILIGLSVLLFVFFWIVAKLSYRFYKYELREDGFRKELGVIYKKYVTIPYDRIQNVDIYRGIVARILGLSDLNIQTAGASGATYKRLGGRGYGAEGRLPGLSRKVAEQLRDELIRRAKQTRTTNQGL